MKADHCEKPDSQVEFTTGNYSVVTTSEVEWKFVAEPHAPIRWPLEKRLIDNGQSDHMRKVGGRGGSRTLNSIALTACTPRY
jgi:lipocalin